PLVLRGRRLFRADVAGRLSAWHLRRSPGTLPVAGGGRPVPSARAGRRPRLRWSGAALSGGLLELPARLPAGGSSEGGWGRRAATLCPHLPRARSRVGRLHHGQCGRFGGYGPFARRQSAAGTPGTFRPAGVAI